MDNLDRERGEAESLEEVGGVVVNLELVVGVREVKGRDLGDVLVLSFSLLLLQLEGDTSNGTLLNTLHEVSSVTSDLVSQSLRLDNSDLRSQTLVGLKVQSELGVEALNDDLGGSLDGFSSYTAL